MNKEYSIKWILLLLMGLGGMTLFAQNLKRQAMLGIQPAPLTEEQAKSLGLPNTNGVLVNQVFPESSATEMGLENEDVILMINDFDILGIPDLGIVLAPLREEDEVKIGVWREGKRKLLKGTLMAKPQETSEHGEIIYDEVAFEEGYLRAIVNKPAGEWERKPAILFIQGYPCNSVDGLPAWHPYKKLVEAFTERGFVVMRVEKTGVGDCMDTPACDQVEMETEAAGFAAGYAHLRKYEFVDTANIFIFGHSLGGLEAPMLASRLEIDPKGVIVYGTVLESWAEYLTKMLRFQNVRLGTDYVQMEKEQRAYMSILYELHVNGTPPGDVASIEPQYDSLLRRDFQWDGGNMLFGRDFTFWQSVHNLELAKYWSETSAYVLAMYGEADIEALDPASHQEIVRLINTYFPGHATFQMVPETNHSFIKVGSMEEGIKLNENPPMMFQAFQNQFNYDFVDQVVKWMEDKLEKDL